MKILHIVTLYTFVAKTSCKNDNKTYITFYIKHAKKKEFTVCQTLHSACKLTCVFACSIYIDYCSF